MDAFEQLMGSLFTKPHDGKEQAHEKGETNVAKQAKELERHLKGFGEKMDVFAKETEAYMKSYGDVDYVFKQQK
ncbi:hypothetical protein [Bacillus sp. 179-C3.3 HS]|uniref:hypothetical protein n=1 Tax=Bacillus sp. 179-C3.3 HS TaxID=3232162 RepID=UPI0039A3F656